MAEASGAGSEVAITTQKSGIVDRLRNAVGLKPKTPQAVPPPSPTSQTTETSSALGQIVQGVKDPVTGETRMPDASWKGPGIAQDDRRLMGEERATSPGNEFLKANEAGMPMPEIPATQPTYIAQGTELDNQPLASSTATETAPETPSETPPNVVPFPTKAEPMEKPMEKPAA